MYGHTVATCAIVLWSLILNIISELELWLLILTYFTKAVWVQFYLLVEGGQQHDAKPTHWRHWVEVSGRVCPSGDSSWSSESENNSALNCEKTEKSNSHSIVSTFFSCLCSVNILY